MSFVWLQADIQIVDSDAIIKEQDRITPKRTYEFKKQAAEIIGVSRKNFEGYVLHPVFPIYGGGTSDDLNLVLMKPEKSESVSRFVTRQAALLDEGETRTIKLPVPAFPMVWNAEDFIPLEKAQGGKYALPVTITKRGVPKWKRANSLEAAQKPSVPVFIL